MKVEFDLEQYLNRSKAVDTSDIPWQDVPKYPIDPDEIRCLTYMMDIEAHTIMYLRDLLNTCAANDSEISTFLACWVYEETYHGRAIESFLRAAGVPVAQDRVSYIREGRKTRQFVETSMTFLISNLTRHFVAAHMTWGAIQELTTLTAYNLMAQRTKHPHLAKLLRRIAQDESRHFSFYYYQAAQRLTETPAQRLTSFLLRRFWAPVGAAVKLEHEVNFVMSFLFGGTTGSNAVVKVDETIGRLPGLNWFDMLQQARERSLSAFASLSLTNSEPSLRTS